MQHAVILVIPEDETCLASTDSGPARFWGHLRTPGQLSYFSHKLPYELTCIVGSSIVQQRLTIEQRTDVSSCCTEAPVRCYHWQLNEIVMNLEYFTSILKFTKAEHIFTSLSCSRFTKDPLGGKTVPDRSNTLKSEWYILRESLVFEFFTSANSVPRVPKANNPKRIKTTSNTVQ